MMNIINWLKHNKLTTLLILVVAYLLLQSNGPIPLSTRNFEQAGAAKNTMDVAAIRGLPVSGGGADIPPTSQDNRLVIRDTTMSLVVQDVAGAIKIIQQKAESLSGYLVDSHLSKPEESASGSISVRVPEDKLSDALDTFRKAGLRVVDEQVSGQDVTDQYVDLDARLATLNKTKAKFEDILDRATQIQDLLNVQRELVNLQAQIDSVKGQQQFLSQSAKLSKITVYLSTDEFSLPYSPKESWRPNVVFKLAVRSLVANLRNIGTALIWILVYTPIWGTIAGLVWIFRKRLFK